MLECSNLLSILNTDLLLLLPLFLILAVFDSVRDPNVNILMRVDGGRNTEQN